MSFGNLAIQITEKEWMMSQRERESIEKKE